MAIGVAKLIAGFGVLTRRVGGAVLGTTLASIDAFFALPALGGARPPVALLEILVDGFIALALIRHLRAMPKEAVPGATWAEFQDHGRS